MKVKGLTLLELVIALTVVSVIMTAGTALLMSSVRTVKRVQDEGLAQQEMVRLFRFASEDMRNIRIDPTAKNVKSGLLLCSVPTGSGTGTELSFKQQGSPCVECYNLSLARTCELQFNRVTTSGETETVTYYYSQINQSNNTYNVEFQRKIDTVSAAGSARSLTYRVFAYADADLNGDGTVTSDEKAVRDACVEQTDGLGRKTSPLNSTDCWQKTPAVFPAFNVSTDQKLIQISARTKFGKPGVTKVVRVDEIEG